MLSRHGHGARAVVQAALPGSSGPGLRRRSLLTEREHPIPTAPPSPRRRELCTANGELGPLEFENVMRHQVRASRAAGLRFSVPDPTPLTDAQAVCGAAQGVWADPLAGHRMSWLARRRAKACQDPANLLRALRVDCGGWCRSCECERCCIFTALQ